MSNSAMRRPSRLNFELLVRHAVADVDAVDGAHEVDRDRILGVDREEMLHAVVRRACRTAIPSMCSACIKKVRHVMGLQLGSHLRVADREPAIARRRIRVALDRARARCRESPQRCRIRSSHRRRAAAASRRRRARADRESRFRIRRGSAGATTAGRGSAHAPRAGRARFRDTRRMLALSPRSGRGSLDGGIMPVRSLRTTFSHCSGAAATSIDVQAVEIEAGEQRARAFRFLAMALVAGFLEEQMRRGRRLRGGDCGCAHTGRDGGAERGAT